MKFFAPTATDFYKTGHKSQYPKGTTEVYSNMTARSNKHVKADRFSKEDFVINFGLQYVIKHLLMDQWEEFFFSRPKPYILHKYDRRIKYSLGSQYMDSDHFGALHDLGYLPIEIKALPEGVKVPIGVPLLTIKNTLPEFFWLTNFLETSLSAMLWKPITSATMAYEYRSMFEYYSDLTGGSKEFIPFQGHDFSFRGLSNIQDAALSGAGHLLSFAGTDTIPAIDLLEDYYGADAENEMVGCSVPATEHSVMCMGGELDELQTFRKLIMETYPSGIISIVSDTWDFWKVITEYLPKLKDEIMARDGKVVIRPDSGDPVKIIAGDPAAKLGTPEWLGAIQCLWNTFGGERNIKGYKTLDPHIGLIYGDSITLDRAKRIFEGLIYKDFASDNVVLGIGSYTYQYTTRDAHGFAIKSTSGVVNGERREIFKDPKTDDGIKKSAKGLLRVMETGGNSYMLQDQVSEQDERYGELKPVFVDGKLIKSWSLEDIRKRIEEA